MLMYMKQEDYNYFDQLLNGLGEAQQRKFLALLKKAGSDKAGADLTKIRVVDDSINDTQAIEQQEMITRIMIKNTYKAVKEGKDAK